MRSHVQEKRVKKGEIWIEVATVISYSYSRGHSSNVKDKELSSHKSDMVFCLRTQVAGEYFRFISSEIYSGVKLHSMYSIYVKLESVFL